MIDWKCLRPAPPEGGGPRGDLELLSRHPLAAGRKVIDGPRALESDLPAHQVLPRIRACSLGICGSVYKVAKRFDLVLVVGYRQDEILMLARLAREFGIDIKAFHHAVELIGRRWTGVILRALLAGPARFHQIRDGIPDISDRMLSERLRELEAEGVVTRSVIPDTPVRVEYALTEKGRALETAIPFPGLAESHSQLAAPIVSAGRVLGGLYVESPEDLRFTYDDEDALVALAAQLGVAIRAMQESEDAQHDAPRPAAKAGAPSGGAQVVVRHFAADDSIFIGDDYLIKGVAGAILRKLVADHVREGRTEFSNRELRRDPQIRLPDLSDNLEARLPGASRRRPP